MNRFEVLDADSHVIEPIEAWDACSHGRLTIAEEPITVAGVTGTLASLQVEGRKLFDVGPVLPLGADHIEASSSEIATSEEARAQAESLSFLHTLLTPYADSSPEAASNPKARLAWMDEEGIDSSLLFPTWGLMWEQFLTDRPDLVTSNMTAYNRWLDEFCSEDARRLIGVRQLSFTDIDWAVGEIARMSEAGARVCTVRPVLVNGKPLGHPDFDRVWDAIVDHNLVVALHVGGMGSSRAMFLHDGWYSGERRGPGSGFTESVLPQLPAQLTLTAMLRMGTFKKRPGLRVGVMEAGAGWVGPWLRQLDAIAPFARIRSAEFSHACPSAPSTYINEQVWFTPFEHEDPRDIIGELGADRLMFSSDYPHPESSPQPLEEWDGFVAQLDAEATSRFFGGNAQTMLYRSKDVP